MRGFPLICSTLLRGSTVLVDNFLVISIRTTKIVENLAIVENFRVTKESTNRRIYCSYQFYAVQYTVYRCVSLELRGHKCQCCIRTVIIAFYHHDLYIPLANHYNIPRYLQMIRDKKPVLCSKLLPDPFLFLYQSSNTAKENYFFKRNLCHL